MVTCPASCLLPASSQAALSQGFSAGHRLKPEPWLLSCCSSYAHSYRKESQAAASESGLAQVLVLRRWSSS